MLEHHIQKTIVYKLAFSPGMRFSELKPDELDNKLFDYHLKSVISDKLVEKDANGLYRLTPEGQRIGVGVLDKRLASLDRAHSVLFLIVRRKSDKAWLLFRRKTHPLLGEVGFMHANPKASEEIFKTAQDELKDKTNLTAVFSYAGSGYFKIYTDDKIGSYTHFTLLAAENVQGEIIQSNPKGAYFWQSDIETIQDNLLPTAKELAKQYQTGQPFFIEESFILD
jgi:hypothetical protein